MSIQGALTPAVPMAQVSVEALFAAAEGVLVDMFGSTVAAQRVMWGYRLMTADALHSAALDYRTMADGHRDCDPACPPSWHCGQMAAVLTELADRLDLFEQVMFDTFEYQEAASDEL